MKETGRIRGIARRRQWRAGSQSRERSRTMRSPGMIETLEEWGGEVPRQRQALPESMPMQRAVGDEQYNPWQGWQGQQMGVAYPQSVMYPHAYSQMYPQPVQQPYVQASPFERPAPAPQHQASRPTKPTHGSKSSASTHHKPARKAYTAPPPSERSEPRAPPPKPKAPKPSHRVRETDYIPIVDEFPPIIQEKIKAEKAAAKATARRARSPSPSSSSTSTESVEEVPRTSIPQASPRLGNPAFQMPRYPTWDGTGQYPKHGGNDQARYAAPPIWPDEVGMRFGPERRHRAPSNTPPCLCRFLGRCVVWSFG